MQLMRKKEVHRRSLSSRVANRKEVDISSSRENVYTTRRKNEQWKRILIKTMTPSTLAKRLKNSSGHSSVKILIPKNDFKHSPIIYVKRKMFLYIL